MKTWKRSSAVWARILSVFPDKIKVTLMVLTGYTVKLPDLLLFTACH
jgi:hypothetical protein